MTRAEILATRIADGPDFYDTIRKPTDEEIEAATDYREETGEFSDEY